MGPGDVVTFTASHTVTQADLNANGGGVAATDGDIDNSATVAGAFDPSGDNLSASASDTDSVPLDIDPVLTVTKQADDDTNVIAGQVITYTYVITNTGNVAATNVTLGRRLYRNRNIRGTEPGYRDVE